ncbi:MAG TPA: MotA/TolQ/ExbB proton channel family protein [Candidatus Binatia bacterium]|jgi:biopolymer transport protein ExbB|nr:MotA/TolQ/ExbB proton channel family protein [Candidatus Binatia bacterium]
MFDVIGIIIKGGPVMIPLIACSVVSLAVVIERFMNWRKIGSREPVENLLDLVEQHELTRAVDAAHTVDSPVARVLSAGLAHRDPSPTKAMEVAAQAEIPVLKKRLVILDTIITLAPLLGLLGTVTGMISSFGIMSQAGIGQPHAVTGGVAEALIATATGLLIAILTLVPYNYFSNRAEQEMERIEYYASRLELLLSGREEKK